MQLVQKLSKELSFLEKITQLKESVDRHRPLLKEIEQKVFQKLRLDWNYNSNAIEGNLFTYGETIALLMEGITAKGKPLKDALDIKGHNDAINFMLDMIHDNRKLNETDIRSLHKMVLGENYYKEAKTTEGIPTKKLINVGQYKTEPNHVRTVTGEIHYYASPEETPAKMQELLSWYNNVVETKSFHPVVLASLFHHRFVAIHPFDDGNGRMIRILTNFILLKFGYPVSVIKKERKQEYYACLSQADRGALIPIIEYIGESVEYSLEIYIKGINGEDINEPDDIDKEIALFRQEIGVKPKFLKKMEQADVSKISISTLTYLKKKLDKFSDLFLSSEEELSVFTPYDRTYIISDVEDFYTSNIEYEKLTFFNYSYTFNEDVFKNWNTLKTEFSIRFRETHFLIQLDANVLTKYYDEKVIDKKFEAFIKKSIQEIMDKIKSFKN